MKAAPGERGMVRTRCRSSGDSEQGSGSGEADARPRAATLYELRGLGQSLNPSCARHPRYQHV